MDAATIAAVGMMGQQNIINNDSSSSSCEMKLEQFDGRQRYALVRFKNEKEMLRCLKACITNLLGEDFGLTRDKNDIGILEYWKGKRSFLANVHINVIHGIQDFIFRDFHILEIMLYHSNFQPQVDALVLLEGIQKWIQKNGRRTKDGDLPKIEMRQTYEEFVKEKLNVEKILK